MNGMWAFLLFLIVIIILQVVMVYLQYRAIKNKYEIVRKNNPYVSVGKVKKKGKQYIALLAFDETGYLIEGFTLSGITSTARFKKLKGIEGIHFSKLEQNIRLSEYKECIAEAVGYIAKKFD